MNQKQAEEKTEEKVTLLSMERDEIVKISYTNKEGTYHFRNVNRNWISEEKPERNILCRNHITYTILNISNTAKLSYRKTIASGVTEADLAQYGLDVPTGSFYMEYKDSDTGEESVYELLIGNLTEP